MNRNIPAKEKLNRFPPYPVDKRKNVSRNNIDVIKIAFNAVLDLNISSDDINSNMKKNGEHKVKRKKL